MGRQGGMQAICGEDNMDSATGMAASEMEVPQAFGQHLDEVPPETDADKRLEKVMGKAKHHHRSTWKAPLSSKRCRPLLQTARKSGADRSQKRCRPLTQKVQTARKSGADRSQKLISA